MTVIPCEQDPRLRAEIERFAEVLKTQAHTLGNHGLDEASFYNSPIFRGSSRKFAVSTPRPCEANENSYSTSSIIWRIAVS